MSEPPSEAQILSHIERVDRLLSEANVRIGELEYQHDALVAALRPLARLAVTIGPPGKIIMLTKQRALDAVAALRAAGEEP